MQDLSLTEKIALLTGVDNFTLPGAARIGLRGLRSPTGPAGVRGPVLDPADRSSSLPAPIALAAPWDPELVERVGRAARAESQAKGVDVLLAPTLNLARSPYGGRGYESYGEDPVLAAIAAPRSCAACSGPGWPWWRSTSWATTRRSTAGRSDVRIDEATLREVYLVPFEACVTEGDCAAVMAGYNLVNGITMTEHEHLLDGVLKQGVGLHRRGGLRLVRRAVHRGHGARPASTW